MFKVSTGDNSAGNGGDGYNSGMITSNPNIEFELSNKAEGSDVHVNTGDNVYQKAYWDAGGANAEAEKYPRQRAELPNRMATRKSDSGHNKSDVEADTKAYQENWLDADQSQNVRPASAATAETTTRRKVGMSTSRPVSSPPT